MSSHDLNQASSTPIPDSTILRTMSPHALHPHDSDNSPTVPATLLHAAKAADVLSLLAALLHAAKATNVPLPVAPLHTTTVSFLPAATLLAFPYSTDHGS